MSESDLEELITGADSASAYARDVRSHHRKRTKRGSPQREADLRIAADRLRSAMEPIRTALGRAQFETPTSTRAKQIERVREASAELQRERRKLWKMRNRPPKETP